MGTLGKGASALLFAVGAPFIVFGLSFIGFWYYLSMYLPDGWAKPVAFLVSLICVVGVLREIRKI
ncbi:hypothetical protein [Haladaptatus halobius]|uniref:hypothetical protein n=1 Tax=Haladaptatus halobius TaxID=2884875 RepID=UPI001D09B6C5|nr:hypothetical protein [Haladaptatus halobius]